MEIDAKYRLLKPGQTIVDLGAAPGSWSPSGRRQRSAPQRAGGRIVRHRSAGQSISLPGASTIPRWTFWPKMRRSGWKGPCSVALGPTASSPHGRQYDRAIARPDHLKIVAPLPNWPASSGPRIACGPGGFFLAKSAAKGGTEQGCCKAELKARFRPGFATSKPGASPDRIGPNSMCSATGYRSH